MVAARYQDSWQDTQYKDAVIVAKMRQRLLPPIFPRVEFDDDESPTYTGNRLWRIDPCDGSEFGSSSNGGSGRS